MDMGQRRLIEKHRVSYLVITGLQELHHELKRYLGLSDSFDLHRSWFLRLWVDHYILLLPCWPRRREAKRQENPTVVRRSLIALHPYTPPPWP